MISAGSSAHNPTWTRDELILALDLYHRLEGNPPRSGGGIDELSTLLNTLGRKPSSNHDFRNANGVYMKLMNFRRFDPRFEGTVGLTKGSKDEAVVWETYSSDLTRLRATAEAVRANAKSTEAILPASVDTLPEGLQEAEEGRLLTVQHVLRERSRKLVEARKSAAIDAVGRLACEACGFDYEATYGEHGKGYIEVHHVQPLSTLRPGTKTKLNDLALVCASCHRMIHSRSKWLTMEELRATLRAG